MSLDKDVDLKDLEAKTEEYSEVSFWDKVSKYAKKAGCSSIYAALLLFYAVQDENIPTKTKMIIYGALGYFISPIDIIPDILPGGFVDDMGGLVIALCAAAMYITDDIKRKAKTKLSEWFDDGCLAEDIEKVDEKMREQN